VHAPDSVKGWGWPKIKERFNYFPRAIALEGKQLMEKAKRLWTDYNIETALVFSFRININFE